VTAPDTLGPRDAREVQDAVLWALSHEKRLELRGGGSKQGIGRPAQSDLTLDLTAISGVGSYEPAELVLTAKAGTPLAEVEALVGSRGQQLAFEPMDFGTLFGVDPGQATLGGTLAANVAGPRRIRAGAARDHFLGFEAVSGRGEVFKAGGRVVKNVTGYDLPKLMAGSWGTLGVLTEVTVKVLPAPETAATVLLLGLSDEQAAHAMSAAVGSPAEVSGAAHLPAWAAGRSPIAAVAGGGQGVTALRLEGVGPSVAARRDHLAAFLAPLAPVEVIERDETLALWRFVRDAEPFAASRDRPLWRISVAPTAGPATVARIAAAVEARALYDWAGGLIWLSVPPSDDAAERVIRGAVAAAAGHATLIRAAPSVRASVAVFQPEPAALAALTKRVKDGFDPQGVLNPGRMWAGV